MSSEFKHLRSHPLLVGLSAFSPCSKFFVSLTYCPSVDTFEAKLKLEQTSCSVPNHLQMTCNSFSWFTRHINNLGNDGQPKFPVQHINIIGVLHLAKPTSQQSSRSLTVRIVLESYPFTENTESSHEKSFPLYRICLSASCCVFRSTGWFFLWNQRGEQSLRLHTFLYWL